MVSSDSRWKTIKAKMRRNDTCIVAGVCVIVSVLLITSVTIVYTADQNWSPTWNCENQKCVRSLTQDTPLSVGECKFECLPYGALWPKPTGAVSFSDGLIQVNPRSISFSSDLTSNAGNLIKKAQDLFAKRLQDKATELAIKEGGYNLAVSIDVESDVTSFVTNLDESYKLKIKTSDEDRKISVQITANNFFGARHGLTTLNQLIIHDDINDQMKIIKTSAIEDGPVFTHRGISLDTARSYIPVQSILRTLDGMEASKLNTLHLHLTDTHSFPFVSKKHPEMSKIGAYSKKQVYTYEDIQNMVEYARVRGIRIIPEFDAPAHVGEGWQLFPDVITCFKWEPWTQYCVEPPCGQFDPTNDKLYDILGDIFTEYAQLFDSDLFHMGGDEVNLNCWNSTDRIVTYMDNNNIPTTSDGFHDLWNIYQTKALEKWRVARPGKEPVILWTSSLTDANRVDHYLSPEEYFIQIWTLKQDNVIGALIRKNFNIILSNYDELYFDCGGPAWVGGPGQNWCSPYIGWQSVYNHKPLEIVKNQGIDVSNPDIKKLILGSEAAVWTEQVDEQTTDYRLWPRSAALAERLWSNPDTTWQDAQYRMNHHRERLVQIGIRAELLQPEWCYHNDGYCGPGV